MSEQPAAYPLAERACVVLVEESSGSEEENMQCYAPSSDLGFRSRKKKKPKAQSKNSQSLFSVILSVNHGLVALQTNTKVTRHASLVSISSLSCFIWAVAKQLAV